MYITCQNGIGVEAIHYGHLFKIKFEPLNYCTFSHTANNKEKQLLQPTITEFGDKKKVTILKIEPKRGRSNNACQNCHQAPRKNIRHDHLLNTYVPENRRNQENHSMTKSPPQYPWENCKLGGFRFCHAYPIRFEKSDLPFDKNIIYFGCWT